MRSALGIPAVAWIAVATLVVLPALSGCLQGAAPLSVAPLPAASVALEARPKMYAAPLLGDLKEFASSFPERYGNVPTHEGARGWLADSFAAAGLTVWRQNYTTGGLAQANIVGIHWGQVRDEWVVVGGHYDTTHWDCAADRRAPEPASCAGHEASQGAYDDGSGTLLTVHLAKTFANVSTYYSIAFVAYDGEERGTEGAQAFVDGVTDGATPFGNVTLHAALDIDMFGITWPGTNAPTQILDNSASLHKVFDEARREIGMPDNMVYCADMVTLGSSDFAIFFAHKVPTVFFSSDFGKVAPPGSPAPAPFAAYPFWHFMDTYDTMQAMAGGATQLQQGFQTASDLTVAIVYAEASQSDLPFDVRAPPQSGGPCGA